MTVAPETDERIAEIRENLNAAAGKGWYVTPGADVRYLLDRIDGLRATAKRAHDLMDTLVGADILDDETIRELSPETWDEIEGVLNDTAAVIAPRELGAAT